MHFCLQISKIFCIFVVGFVKTSHVSGGRRPKSVIYLRGRSPINEMENRKFDERREPEIVYSRSVKAGKRIYYLDVKKDRTGDYYLCITESKKRVMGEEAPQFEKHKLFLYKEDFAHFSEGLEDVIAYVKGQVGKIESRKEWTPEEASEAPAEAKEEAAEASAAEPEKKRGIFDRLMGKD